MHSTFMTVLRHGETTAGSRFCGSTDCALTAQGWQQMQEAIAQVMHSQGGQPWDVCVSSPLKRCADFAEQLSTRLKIPLLIEPGLQEMHFGAWENKTAVEIMQDDEASLTRFWENPLACTPPQAEALADFAQRIQDAWDQLIQAQSGKRILIMSHGGVMRYLACRAAPQTLDKILQVNVAHAQMMQFSQTADRLQKVEDADA